MFGWRMGPVLPVSDIAVVARWRRATCGDFRRQQRAVRDLSRIRVDAFNARVQARHQLKGFPVGDAARQLNIPRFQ